MDPDDMDNQRSRVRADKLWSADLRDATRNASASTQLAVQFGAGRTRTNGEGHRSDGDATLERAVRPSPGHESCALGLVVDMAMEYLDDGELDVRGAVHDAAMHGWFEGHLEGETCDRNCRRKLA